MKKKSRVKTPDGLKAEFPESLPPPEKEPIPDDFKGLGRRRRASPAKVKRRRRPH